MWQRRSRQHSAAGRYLPALVRCASPVVEMAIKGSPARDKAYFDIYGHERRLICPAHIGPSKVALEGIYRMVYLSIDSVAPTPDLEDLSEWLVQEPELRGLIRDVADTAGPGELGAPVEVLVAAVGSGGTLSVLITSLQSWLSSVRRTDLTVKLTGPN